MRRFHLTVVLFAGVALACGGEIGSSSSNSDPLCTNPIVGNWFGTTQSDHLAIGNTNAFTYSGVDGCTNHGTIDCPDANISSGSLRVHVSDSTGGACLATGDHTCAFTVTGSFLQYDCSGSGALHYRR